MFRNVFKILQIFGVFFHGKSRQSQPLNFDTSLLKYWCYVKKGVLGVFEKRALGGFR